MNSIINTQVKNNLRPKEFLEALPYPWLNIDGLLTEEFYNSLKDTWPKFSLFEKHEGLDRNYGQRPHNRYYLAYENSLYTHRTKGRFGGPGAVKHEQLSPSWRQFIEYLTSKDYQDFIKEFFECKKFETRFSWHMQTKGWDVSPHVDSPLKLGTHLFYFNNEEDWHPQWGGGTAVLWEKKTDSLNPEFNDFSHIFESKIVRNQSFLFKNTPNAWHGMRPLNCPEDSYRKLFTVIFNYQRPNKLSKKFKNYLTPLKLLFKAN